MDPFQDRSVSGPVSGSQQESPPGVCRTGFPYASLSRSFGGRTAIVQDLVSRLLCIACRQRL